MHNDTVEEYGPLEGTGRDHAWYEYDLSSYGQDSEHDKGAYLGELRLKERLQIIWCCRRTRFAV